MSEFIFFLIALDKIVSSLKTLFPSVKFLMNKHEDPKHLHDRLWSPVTHICNSRTEDAETRACVEFAWWSRQLKVPESVSSMFSEKACFKEKMWKVIKGDICTCMYAHTCARTHTHYEKQFEDRIIKSSGYSISLQQDFQAKYKNPC